MDSLIHNLRLASQWLWLVLLFGVGARFSWVAAAPIIAERAHPADVEPQEPVAPPPAPAVAAPAPQPVIAAPEQVHVMLLVSTKQGRSKVLINGAFVGFTTYAADFGCKRGEPLTFELIFPNGATVEHTRSCEGPTLVISE